MVLCAWRHYIDTLHDCLTRSDAGMDLIQRLEETRDQTVKLFALGDDDLARTYAEGKWPVPLDISCRVYESVRNAVIYYAERYYAAKGHLEFVHSVTGVRTLKQEFEKVASHNRHHLDQIRTALARA